MNIANRSAAVVLENVRKHFGLVATAADIEQIWSDSVAKPRLTAVGG